MKKLTRLFSIFLVIALLFCFGGCKNEPSVTAKALIDAGEYEKAYDLLLAIENPTEEEKTLLSGFFFQELERTETSSGKKVSSTYDETGRLISRHTQLTSYQWNEEVFTYDEKGNLVTKDMSDRDGRWERTSWTYDEKDNVLTEEYTHYRYDDYKYTYTYDKKGNMLTKYRIINDATNHSTSRGWHSFVYTYDEKGNLIKEEYTYDYPFAMEHWHTMTYTHDERGNVLSKTSYDQSGALRHTTTYTYDEKNNLLTEDSNTKHDIYAYTYDDKGNTISQTYTGDHSSTKTVWEYNEAGKLISKVSTILSSGEEYEREEYTYDTYGNPITHYQKEYSDEVFYTIKWKLFYNPVLAAKPAEERTAPEPEHYLDPRLIR